MGEHYFTNNPGSESDRREIALDFRGESYRFITDSGVFSRDKLDKGTEALLKAPLAIGKDVLDMCCGWGPIGVIIARENAASRLLLRDVNTRAVALAQENIRINGLQNASAEAADGFAGLDAQFDTVLMNPPIRAGKTVIYGLFSDAFAHLRAGGRLYIVIRKAQGAPSAKAYLGGLFGEYNVETIARQGGYHVLCAEKNP